LVLFFTRNHYENKKYKGGFKEFHIFLVLVVVDGITINSS